MSYGGQKWDDPVKFDCSSNEDLANLEAFVSQKGENLFIHDQIDDVVSDLYDIKFPSEKDDRDNDNFEKFSKSYGKDYGNWFYFSWSNQLVRYPLVDDLRAVRTSRNRNLISAEEQKKLYSATILIAGLSVGSNVVEALLSQGIGSKIIICDMDTLEPSNLNRIRASFPQTGIHKVDFVAKLISEIDPYIEQVHLKDGLSLDLLKRVIADHKPDVIVDEVDDLRMKIGIRRSAKTNRLPVVMGTDNGDDILLDIERYDNDSNYKLFSGIVPNEVIDQIENGSEMSRSELGKLIGQYFVGFNFVPIRMLESVFAVGKTLPSWPQLGGAAALCGIYVAYSVKSILLGRNIRDGRFHVGPDKELNPDISTAEYESQKMELLSKLSG